MHIQILTVGPLQTNCYLLVKEQQVLIIDPGAEFAKIQKAIQQTAAQPIAILLTHGHFDHIGAVEETRSYYQIPLYMGEKDSKWLSDPSHNLSEFIGEPIICQAAEYTFSHDEHVSIGPFDFHVRLTPGHTPGSVSYVFDSDKMVFTGDCLFAGAIGRTDFPGGQPAIIHDTIKEKLFSLPMNYSIYPGHGSHSTIATEKRNNPFFQ